MLEVNKIHKFFDGKEVINGYDFKIPTGSICGLIGPNGAGKSTTFRIILGLLKPEKGNILWMGKEIDYFVRDSIGYLPEQRSLMPKFTVLETLIYFAGLKGIPKAKVLKEWDYWANKLEIQQYKKSPIQTLSKGNQQKIQVLVALIHKPKFLIFDEPFSGLDPLNRELLIDILNIQLNKKTTILFSTHNIDDIESYCNNIIILNKGNIVYKGTVIDLKNSYISNTIFFESNNIKDIYKTWSSNSLIRIIYSNRETIIEAKFDDQKILLNEFNKLKKEKIFNKLELKKPSLKSIFIEVINENNKRGRNV